MSRHQLSIRFQGHLLAQAVPAQHLMGFRQADFPGQARVVNGAHGSRPCAALAAGNQDAPRPGLGHAAGNGADAGGGHQFDCDLRLLVGALQVVDQLGQILDGINVVVGRRRDQRDAGGGAAGFRHAVRHLGSGQVPALPGRGPLGHFDLDFFGGKQVFPCHAEAPGGHLLDGGIKGSAVPHGQFPALAAVAFAAQVIHGLGHTFVGLLGDGAVAHGPGAEAAHDLRRAFHLVQRDFPTGVKIEGQHGTDGARPLVFHPGGVLIEQLLALRPDRLLQKMDGFGSIQMLLRAFSRAQLVHANAGQPGGQPGKSGLMVEPAVRFHPA